jgi:hypothetical protein
MKTAPTLIAAVLLANVAGCSETYQRLDGVTPGSGDAIAANTVMQMVDPWQYGVQNTDLKVPADRANALPATAAANGDSSGDAPAAADGGSKTTGY